MFTQLTKKIALFSRFSTYYTVVDRLNQQMQPISISAFVQIKNCFHLLGPFDR